MQTLIGKLITLFINLEHFIFKLHLKTFSSSLRSAFITSHCILVMQIPLNDLRATSQRSEIKLPQVKKENSFQVIKA